MLELAPGISGAAGAVASAFAFATWKARARSIGGGNDQGHPTLEKTMRKAQKSQKTSKNKNKKGFGAIPAAPERGLIHIRNADIASFFFETVCHVCV